MSKTEKWVIQAFVGTGWVNGEFTYASLEDAKRTLAYNNTGIQLRIMHIIEEIVE